MENVLLVVVGLGIVGLAAVVAFAMSKKNSEILDENDLDVSPVADPGIPGIIPGTPQIVTEYDDEECCDESCASCNDEEAEECDGAKIEIVMITIDSIAKIKTKSREFLMMDSGANLTKKEADAILDNLSVPFDASNMDLANAPFKYTVVK
jgi:thioredoxin reductase